MTRPSRKRRHFFGFRVFGGECKSCTSLVLARSVPPHPCPLPEGEGRGEGERAVEIEDGGSLAIGSPNSSLNSGFSGRGLKLGAWCFSGCWMLVVGCLLLLAHVCFAQRQAETRPAPLDPVQAEREARALV